MGSHRAWDGDGGAPAMTVVWAAAAALLALMIAGAAAVWKRRADIWLPAYLRGDWAGRRASKRGVLPVGGERNPSRHERTTHVIFCFADHFEPGVHRPGLERERERVVRWIEDYPRIADAFRDADGRPPQHTFFYPAEEYRPEHLDRLAALVERGYGEVEIHLHHDNDTSEGLRGKLIEFRERLRSHGLLGADRGSGAARFAFVHGNWALDNSAPDGRWCGVNDELTVLRDCGCYADFTLPSAPSPTQTRRINSIYYATDDPTRPRSHDDGVEAAVGRPPQGDLLLIQGPLGLRRRGGLVGLLPKVENADIGRNRAPDARRVDAWVRTRICVAGREDWVFVKVHTHGCSEGNWGVLFGEPILQMHRCLTERYNDGQRWRLHYVTAREAYNIVRAAERGLDGDPGRFRDLEVLPPPVRSGALCERI